MSLMRLLTVSRSFTTGVESGRYKMAEKGALPCFESSRRFHQTLPHVNCAAPDLANQPSGPALLETIPGPAALPGFPGAQPAVEVVRAPICEQPSGQRKTRSVMDVAKLTPVREWFQRKSTASTKAVAAKPPGAGSPTQQALLSLDEVHVVRNDLADSDYEVLPARGSWVEPGKADLSSERSRFGMVGMAWSEAAARLFHSERARV